METRRIAWRCVRFALAVGAVGSASASDNWREIQVGENALVYTTENVHVRGAWGAMADYSRSRIPNVNVTQIDCERSTMKCTESLAQVEQLRNRDPSSSPYLYAYTFEYAVQSWTSESVVSKRVNPRGLSVDETLTIEMKKGVVRKQWKDRPQSDGYFYPPEQSFELLVKTPYAR